MKMILSTKQMMSSLEIAKLTGKNHGHVLRDIRSMLKELYDYDSNAPLVFNPKMDSVDFKGVNIFLNENKTTQEIDLDYAHTQTLITGYSITLRKKVIDRWLALETKELSKITDKQLRSELRVEFRPMTDAIVDSRQGKDVKFYHFTTEADLINRIVFGCSSAKFKVQHDIEKNESLRDFLTIEQKNALISLQRANTVFLLMGMEFEERKAHLTKLYDKQHSAKLIEEHMRLGA